MQEILSIDTAGLLKACIDNKISFFDGIKSGYSINMYDLPLMLIQLLKQTFLSFKYPRFNTKKTHGRRFLSRLLRHTDWEYRKLHTIIYS